MELSGLVLAGGASKRMGRDKAAILLDGELLVDRAVRILATICCEVMVASGDGTRLDLRPVEVPLRQVADPVAGAGPLAGILAGLAAASGRALAVVAVDAPFIDPGVLTRCAERLDDAPACLPAVRGVAQPLHAVWSTAAAPAVAAAFAAGERSPRRLAVALGATVIPEDEWREVAGAGERFAESWNRPEDVVCGEPEGGPASPDA